MALRKKKGSLMSRPDIDASRRHFLKTSAGGTLAAGLSLARSVHAAGSDGLRIGLVGCGGRGTGAAVNALSADPNTRLVALADAFPEQIPGTLARLQKAKGEQVAVDADHQFGGLDGYRSLIDSVDVVLLATPAHFHPIHLTAAVEAGKHVFVEKPHAVDPTQVRMVKAACELAKEKNRCVVSGLCWRHHAGVRETMKRIHDGAIGQVVSVQETYMTGFSWTRPRLPDDTEMKYQVRNWYNFHWLSGDLPGLTLIHSIDKGSWALGDVPPVRAWATGGRQVRTGAEYGDVYDHHAIVYEYANGARMYAYVRQHGGCYNSVDDQLQGTKGRCDLIRQQITGENEWRYDGPSCNMHQAEHDALFHAIRSGETINSGHYMVISDMLQVMGRMASYTGKVITWDEAMASTLSLAPSAYTWEAVPPTQPGADGNYPIAMPGITQ